MHYSCVASARPCFPALPCTYLAGAGAPTPTPNLPPPGCPILPPSRPPRQWSSATRTPSAAVAVRSVFTEDHGLLSYPSAEVEQQAENELTLPRLTITAPWTAIAAPPIPCERPFIGRGSVLLRSNAIKPRWSLSTPSPAIDHGACAVPAMGQKNKLRSSLSTADDRSCRHM